MNTSSCFAPISIVNREERSSGWRSSSHRIVDFLFIFLGSHFPLFLPYSTHTHRTSVLFASHVAKICMYVCLMSMSIFVLLVDFANVSCFFFCFVYIFFFFVLRVFVPLLLASCLVCILFLSRQVTKWWWRVLCCFSPAALQQCTSSVLFFRARHTHPCSERGGWVHKG